MTDAKERCEKFSDYLNELYSREMSNSKDYDKAILTLSTAALGLSLAFIKDVVPLADASAKLLLYISWGLFAFAIVLVITSYFTSQKGIHEQVGLVNQYIANGNEDIFSYDNLFGRFTVYLNFASGAVFVVAIGLTVAFVFINIQKVSNIVSTKEQMQEQCTNQNIPFASLPKPQNEERGAPIPQAPKQPKPSSQQSSGGGQAGGAQDSGSSSPSSGSSNKK